MNQDFLSHLVFVWQSPLVEQYVVRQPNVKDWQRCVVIHDERGFDRAWANHAEPTPSDEPSRGSCRLVVAS